MQTLADVPTSALEPQMERQLFGIRRFTSSGQGSRRVVRHCCCGIGEDARSAIRPLPPAYLDVRNKLRLESVCNKFLSRLILIAVDVRQVAKFR